MKRKRKPGEPTAEMIASIAGVSVQLVYRKLRMGKSAKEIINEAAARQALPDLPVIPINGSAAAAALVPYSISQAKKEAALAKIREYEAGEMVGELISKAEVVMWIRHLYTPLINGLRGLPVEMRDFLGPELAEVLQRRIDGLISTADRYLESCAGPKPLVDGLLDCPGGHKVRWEIIPPPPEAA